MSLRKLEKMISLDTSEKWNKNLNWWKKMWKILDI